MGGPRRVELPGREPIFQVGAGGLPTPDPNPSILYWEPDANDFHAAVNTPTEDDTKLPQGEIGSFLEAGTGLNSSRRWMLVKAADTGFVEAVR